MNPLTPRAQPAVTAAGRTLSAALATLLLTSVHHVYGAVVYGTPWRNHAAHVSAVTAVVLVGALLAFRRRAGTPLGTATLWLLMLVTLLLPVIGIGLIEGGYNHALKDALYFGGVSRGALLRLFPPPTYELPNDVFFEVTGVLQVVVGWVAARRLLALFRQRAAVARPTPGVACPAGRPVNGTRADGAVDAW
jgi:hypothetical protein